MTFTCQMLSKLSSCDLPCPITAGKTVIDTVIDTNMCRKRSLHVYATIYWYTKRFEAWLYLQLFICSSRKRDFRYLFTFTLKAWTYTDVPARLIHCTHSASIIWNRKTQRSLVRGRGSSIRVFVDLFCCFTSQDNSYVHGGTVSSSNRTVPGQA